MKQGIHPQITTAIATCARGGAKYEVKSPYENKAITIEQCRNCHPVYTGKTKSHEASSSDEFSKKFGGLSLRSMVKKKAKKD